MYEIDSLFFYKAWFRLELRISERLFVLPLRRKQGFAYRLPIAILVLFGVAFGFPVISTKFYYQSVRFFILAIFSSLGLFFCFDESYRNILFCTRAGYATQHLAYSIHQLIRIATALDGGASLNIYGNGPWSFNWVSATIYVQVYLLVYLAVYFLLARRNKKGGEFYISNYWLFLLLIFFFVSAVMLNSIMVEYCNVKKDRIPFIVTFSYSMLNCILGLILQFKLKDEKKIRHDLEFIRHLWKEDKEHYELAKENINIINIKCHDLKHQIHQLRSGYDEKAIKEIERSVRIYDSLTKTGNDALDVLLSEKRLLCGKENISLTYVVDGKALSFISESDIYSLFGNALENSIDYLKGIEDKSKRFIRLSVKPIEKNLVIHVENYYEGKDLSFIDGLPKTTKGDENYHGFGLKSIKEIVSLYSGDFFIKTKNHLFIVDALIPIPEEKK